MKKTLLTIAAACMLLTACGAPKAPPAEPFEVVLARAEQGDADAQFQIGAIYHDGQDGIPRNLTLAREWFEKSAGQGDERAQFNLGVMYYSSEGVKQDYALALQWFEKAAAQKNARAQFNLGVMYYRGEGVKQDYPQAVSYFGEAAAQGFNEAAFNLGVMYAKGEGVAQDIGKAYSWFSVAGTYGNERADEAMSQIKNGLNAEQLKQVESLATELEAMVKKSITEAAKAAEAKLKK